MSKPPHKTGKHGKAPTGQWEMPDDTLTSTLGHFLMAWSLVESTVEVAIAKQLYLAPLEGSIVTAGAGFRNRTSMLLSLLNRDPETNEEAISTVKQMNNVSDRNDVLHSVIGGSKSLIWFNRRKTGAKFTSKIERYDGRRLKSVALKFSDLSGDLMRQMDISTNDYLSFFQDAHDAVNSE